MKRIFVSLLTLIMAISILPTSIFAEDEMTSSVLHVIRNMAL